MDQHWQSNGFWASTFPLDHKSKAPNDYLDLCQITQGKTRVVAKAKYA